MNKKTIEMVKNNPPSLPKKFEEDIKERLCNNYAFAMRSLIRTVFTVLLAKNITSDRQTD